MATPNGYNSVLAVCPHLQVDLDEAWINGMFPTEHVPEAEFLTSATNNRGIKQMIVPGNGSIRTVDVRYTRRRLEENVKTNQANPNCTASYSYGNETTSYTIDPSVNVQDSTIINLNDDRLSCVDSFKNAMRDSVDVVDRKVASIIATQSVALAGGWGGDVPSTTGTITNGVVKNGTFYQLAFNATSGAPMPGVWPDLRNALDDSGFPDEVALFGGNTLRRYFQFLAAGCCTNDGIDLSEMMAQYGYAAAKDKRVADALGSQDSYLAIAPGALQVLNYSRAEGKPLWGQLLGGGAGSNYFMTTVASPRFGLTYDVNAKDDCGTLHLTVTATIKTIGLPADMYVAPVASGSGATGGDEYYGVTGVVKGKLILS